MAKNVLNNPGRALDITANNFKAAASRNTKNLSSTLTELKTFYNTVKVLYLGKFVYFILYKWSKNRNDYTHLHLQ